MDGFHVARNSIPANHVDLCKFSGLQDIGYKRTSRHIIDFVSDAMLVTKGEPTGSERSLAQELIMSNRDIRICEFAATCELNHQNRIYETLFEVRVPCHKPY
jgi:hypothetical protein